MIRFILLACCLTFTGLPAVAAEGGGPGSTPPPVETPPPPKDEVTPPPPGGGGPRGEEPVDPKKKDEKKGTEGEQEPRGGIPGIWLILGIVVLLFFMMMSSRKAQKREKAQREKTLAELKVGDKVVTIGLMHGEVVRKGEGTVDLKVSEMAGGTVTFDLAAVAKVNPGQEPEKQT